MQMLGSRMNGDSTGTSSAPQTAAVGANTDANDAFGDDFEVGEIPFSLAV
jgi:hypothetical protein